MNAPERTKSGWRFRVLVYAMGVAISSVVLLCITGIVTGRWPDLLLMVLSTSGLTALCLVTLVAAGAVLRRRRFRFRMTIGTLTVMPGTAVALVALWGENGGSGLAIQTLWCMAFTLIACGVVLTHSGLLGLLRMRSRLLQVTRALTVVSLATFGFILALAMWGDLLTGEIPDPISEFLIVGIVVLAPAAVVGTIVTPIAALSRANRRERPIESMESRITVLLECPGCAHRQPVSTGGARCAQCGKGLFIEVEEPRCECGYLLYRLESDACPECGRAIDPALRWTAEAEEEAGEG